jgi:two-component system nitrate/nitrite response regulator NarL
LLKSGKSPRPGRAGARSGSETQNREEGISTSAIEQMYPDLPGRNGATASVVCAERPTRVAIVAGTRVCAEALRSSLAEDRDVVVVETAVWRDGDTRVDGATDVVVVHLLDGVGVKALRALRERIDGARLVALGVPDDEVTVLAYAEAGASAYLPRDASLDELRSIVKSAARGEALSSPRIVAALFERLADLASVTRSANGLTPRELQIVRLVGENLSNKEIAEHLCLEVSTVKNHVHNALKKLGVSRRADAAMRVRSAERPS